MVLRVRGCGMGVVVAGVAGARGWWVLGCAVSVMMSANRDTAVSVAAGAGDDGDVCMWVGGCRRRGGRRDRVGGATLLGGTRGWIVGMRVTELVVRRRMRLRVGRRARCRRDRGRRFRLVPSGMAPCPTTDQLRRECGGAGIVGCTIMMQWPEHGWCQGSGGSCMYAVWTELDYLSTPPRPATFTILRVEFPAEQIHAMLHLKVERYWTAIHRLLTRLPWHRQRRAPLANRITCRCCRLAKHRQSLRRAARS